MKNIGHTIGELARTEFVDPEPFLGAWLTSGKLVEVYAWRGLGKSFFTWSLTHAVATGREFLGWRGWDRSRRAVIFDCEMGGQACRDRVMTIDKYAAESVDGEALRFITFEDCPGLKIWNLAGTEQTHYNEVVQNYDLVVIDHVSGCCRPVGREMEDVAWGRVESWAAGWRAKGKTIIFVHHAGKSGAQRGTSRREDSLDLVINLKTPPAQMRKPGACFELHFEKTRGRPSSDYDPKFVHLDESLGWTWKPLDSAHSDTILDLKGQGFKDREVADILGLTTSQIKYIQKREEQKLYEVKRDRGDEGDERF